MRSTPIDEARKHLVFVVPIKLVLDYVFDVMHNYQINNLVVVDVLHKHVKGLQ
jgi:hypothetical protein